MQIRLIPVKERAWVEKSNCLNLDPEIFYPTDGASTAVAKAICRTCPVRAECLEYALTNGERFGVWGGRSERDRRKMRRARRDAEKAIA